MEKPVLTMEEVQAQVAARAEALARTASAAADGSAVPELGPQVVARDEALERLCGALSYMENSLAELRASRAKLAKERDEMVCDAVAARGEAKRLGLALERERERALCIEGEVEKQRAKQQRAFLDNRILRDELRSLRLAHREVARQEPLAQPDPAAIAHPQTQG